MNNIFSKFSICLIIFLYTGCAKDERNWQETLIPDTAIFDVIWVNNQFVAAGAKVVQSTSIDNQWGNAVSLTSPDGISWNVHETGVYSDSFNKIYWNNNQYIMFGNDAGFNRIILTSPDAINWISISPVGMEPNFTNLAWDGNKYLTRSGFSGFIYSSTDLIIWQRIDLTNPNWSFGEIFFQNGVYLTSGSICTSSCSQPEFSVHEAASFYSHDGLNWSQMQSLNGEIINNIFFQNSSFYLTGTSGRIFTSTNGQDWSNHSVLFGPSFFALTFLNGEYFLPVNLSHTNGAMEIWSTSDFSSWKQYVYKEAYSAFTGLLDDHHREFTSAATDGTKVIIAGYDTNYQKHNLENYTGIILTSS